MLNEFKKLFDTQDASQYNIKDLDGDIEVYFTNYLLNDELDGVELTIGELAQLIAEKMSILSISFLGNSYAFDGRYHPSSLIPFFSVSYNEEDTEITIKYQPYNTIKYKSLKIQYK